MSYPDDGALVQFVAISPEKYAELLRDDEIDDNAVYFVSDEFSEDYIRYSICRRVVVDDGDSEYGDVLQS